MTATPTVDRVSRLRQVLLPVILVLAGVAVLLYPVIATQYNNARQSEVSQQYARLQAEADAAEMSEQLDRARAYNSQRAKGPILDPWLARVSEDNTEYQEYLDQLDAFDVMARLTVPSVGIDLPIYHGTSEEVLQEGVGHLYGSDLPVGGDGTHSVLTAHTGLTNATLFDNLDEVAEGDVIYVQVSGETLKYQVHGTQVVLPDETDSLKSAVGEDLVTLITCTPYGVNTHRLLVHAHRVPMDENESIDGDSSWPLWMWAMLIAALLVIVLLAFWLYRQYKRNASIASGDDLNETV